MTDTSLIDVLKAARDTLASRVYEPSYDEMLPIKCSACGCLGKTPARVTHRPFCILLKLNTHIARLESPELVESVALTIALSTMRETTGKNAQDAIDAVLGV